MNNQNKLLSIIICIIAFICILLGILLATRNNSTNNDNKNDSENGIIEKEENTNQSPTTNEITYDEAIAIAESLYKQDDRTVLVIEEDNRYIIEIKELNDILKNKFYLDKETGIISDAGVSISGDVSSG